MFELSKDCIAFIVCKIKDIYGLNDKISKEEDRELLVYYFNEILKETHHYITIGDIKEKDLWHNINNTLIQKISLDELRNIYMPEIPIWILKIISKKELTLPFMIKIQELKIKNLKENIIKEENDLKMLNTTNEELKR